MKTARIGFWTLMVVLACSVATAKEAALGPVETMQAYQKALASNPPKLGVFWNQLPESYQSEIEGLIEAFAEQTDAELWDAGFRVLGKVAKVAGTQGEYIRKSPMFGAVAASAGDKPFFTEQKHWDAIVSIVETIAESDLSTHEGLEELEVDKFLDNTVGKIAQSGIDLALASSGQKADAKAELAKFKNGKFTLVNEEDESATVSFEADGKTTEIKLTKVEDKWVFAELASDFEAQIKNAKGSLKMAKVSDEQKKQILSVTKAIEEGLDELLTAKSQADFDKICAAQAEKIQGKIGAAAAAFVGPGAEATGTPATNPGIEVEGNE
jgi:hypothetical protein